MTRRAAKPRKPAHTLTKYPQNGYNCVMDPIVLKDLREKADKIGRSELSRRMDVTPQLMCDVLAGRRSIGSKMLDYLGYERVVTYVRKRK